MRACEQCGGSLDGRRSDARCCSGACRAAASRERRSQAHVSALAEPPPRLRTFAQDLALGKALRYGVEVTATVRLHPVAERDAALRELYESDPLPEVAGWDEDADDDGDGE